MQVFPCFLEWKTLVEKSLNQKLKALRTDNGGGFKSVRTVIALAVQKGLKLHQMDVATDFLNGELKEEVYMKQPDGFVTNGQDHIDGLQAETKYLWLEAVIKMLECHAGKKVEENGFVQTDSEPCIYLSTCWRYCIGH